LTFLELSNMNAVLSSVSLPVPSRKAGTAMGLLAVMVLGLMAAFPTYALDLVAFTGITGPLTTALAQLAALGPSVKALVAFVGFVVAFISLAALRNFGPVLFYLGMAIFGAVGLIVAGAILGAVI
jgi:hypothetical protein